VGLALLVTGLVQLWQLFVTLGPLCKHAATSSIK
jgi:hypothetical protein